MFMRVDLAGAGGAHDGNDLAALDLQGSAAQGLDLDLAHLVDLGEVPGLDNPIHYPPPPPNGPPPWLRRIQDQEVALFQVAAGHDAGRYRRRHPA